MIERMKSIQNPDMECILEMDQDVRKQLMQKRVGMLTLLVAP